ncbi:thrombospondin type-1 domain-containing protein 4-like [Aricia agestis]|uniref:thrombospondin type-1 domain-containing protein 4-like n=1 Tax=Aricia agestis TaxID=91739 RepID=UPI001C205824|nr:thrombospondin type-1 domain-containing protein 4-like [Aricia agestis]XP_041984628.1 thrombospondin type-1 domain-containing protein 4-like [Aricia agestis]
MELRTHLLVCMFIYIASTRADAQTTEVDLRRTTTPAPTNSTAYAWSSWGAWSSCSRSCGGGVSVQERQCLPRDPTRWRGSRKRRKLVRRANARKPRDVTNPECPGLSRRYHECNTEPCPGPVRDPRAEQCSAYDRRPFRGRFYTWAPYVDGNAPCILNCRPRGQQFYASLALVADGTPCTRPGYRAICVQGSCKAVGREGVLASSALRDVRCGQRLVSGLFSRPRLPLGYSYVTTVPHGACRLNVSEIVPSENYIALRVSNGSYIVNGEFAVSAPGTYEAAGARFVYTRQAGLDNIYAVGPIHHPVDIMVLYTQPNPNIKYEYLTDSLNDESSNDIPTINAPPHQRHHRHHNAESHRAPEKEPSLSNQPEFNSLEAQNQVDSNVIGDRKFVWKILAYTQCSRSCGGGLQIGKFKCVEQGGKDREVSPAHCSGSPPPSRRRRCGTGPCPPRWRAAAWGPCPVCGPSHRTRIVGCVQDHARGITKISDQKCPLPMPPSSEPCDIPNCDGTAKGSSPRLDARRQVRPIDRTDTFRDGPVISVPANVSRDVGFKVGPAYSHTGLGGWLYTEWSECVGSCVGGGVQSRGVRCSEPTGCKASHAPRDHQSCTPKRRQCDAEWFTSEWSPCSAACSGRQIRGVICIGGNGRRLRDGSCKGIRPDAERSCGGECAATWYTSDWGECSGPCEAGVQTRTVRCGTGSNTEQCGGARPVARRPCVPARCTTRPPERPAVINPVPDPQSRVIRHQTANVKEQTFIKGACTDRLSNCVLAVQARLCHYHFYGDNCCHSCRGR